MDLVDMQEIADMLGVTYVTVRQWRYLGRLPEPMFVAGNSPMWERKAIKEWSKRTGHPRPSNGVARRRA